MTDFTPISCCNVLYKCYAYVLAARLKRVLPTLISKVQNTFVKGKHLIASMILHELVRGYHRSGGKPRAVIKVDLMKAYHKADWEFSFSAMCNMGFPMLFLSWNRICFTIFYQSEWLLIRFLS